MSDKELEQRIETARAAVRAAIPYFNEHFSKVESFWKRDDSRVTEADLTISGETIAFLKKAFPNDDFCSEEDLPAPGDPARKLHARFAWVLDPIDGTNNFARGMAICAISLALLENGFPVYGIIYDFSQKSLLEGGKTIPLSRDGVPAKPFSPEFDHHSLVSFHYPIKPEKTKALLPFTTVNPIRVFGSAALTLAYNAFGAIDGSTDYNTKVWDIAAAVAMIEAAGREIIYLGKTPAFPLREVSADMPRLRWIAGTPSFLARAREVGLI